MQSRVGRYLAHLDRLFAGQEPRFLPIESSNPALKDVLAITYADLPEPGSLSAVTYGLSLADHAAWRLGKPELWISVRSQDDRWARSAAYVADQFRGVAAFAYGETINFNERMSSESPITAFVVLAPSALDRSNYMNIDVGDALPINLAGLCPIHDAERQWIHEHGLDAF